MDIINRVQNILIKPKEEWVKIKQESIPVVKLFTSYAMILAAIPAVAQFIGLMLIGRRYGSFGYYHYSIGNALVYALLSYIVSYLLVVYVFGIIINALAPTFGSKQNLENAMKLAVFSMTPFYIAGILFIIPILGIFSFLAGLYGIYILYLGFNTPMMDTPKEKVAGYMVVSIIVLIVLFGVVSFIIGSLFAVGAVSAL